MGIAQYSPRVPEATVHAPPRISEEEQSPGRAISSLVFLYAKSVPPSRLDKQNLT